MWTVFGVSASKENVGVTMVVLIFNTPFLHPHDKLNAKKTRFTALKKKPEVLLTPPIISNTNKV